MERLYLYIDVILHVFTLRRDTSRLYRVLPIPRILFRLALLLLVSLSSSVFNHAAEPFGLRRTRRPYTRQPTVRQIIFIK